MPLDIANFIGNPAQSYMSAGKTLTDITDTLDYTSTLAFKIDKFLNQLEDEKQAKAIAFKTILDNEMVNKFNAQYKVDSFNSNEMYRRDVLAEKMREFNTTAKMRQQQLAMKQAYNQHMMNMNQKKYELAKAKLDLTKSRLAQYDAQKRQQAQAKAKQQSVQSDIDKAYAKTMNEYQQKLINAKTEKEKKDILNYMIKLNREYRANGGKSNLLYGVSNLLSGSKTGGGMVGGVGQTNPQFNSSSYKDIYNKTISVLSSRNGRNKVKSAIAQLRANGKSNIADAMEKAYMDYNNIGKDKNKDINNYTNDTFNSIGDKDSINNIVNNQGYIGEHFSNLPYVKHLFGIKDINEYKYKVRNIYKNDIKKGKVINNVPVSKYLIDYLFNHPYDGFSRNPVAGAGFDRSIFKSVYKKVYGKEAPSNIGDFVGSYGSTSNDKREIFKKVAGDKNYPYAQIAKESAKKLVATIASGNEIEPTAITITVDGKKKQIMLSPEEIKGFANIYSMYNLIK